jgi:hypothetical protein
MKRVPASCGEGSMFGVGIARGATELLRVGGGASGALILLGVYGFGLKVCAAGVNKVS